MKPSGAAFILLLLASIPCLAAEGSHTVEATLSLPFETVLPGVPFDMTVTLRNTSTAAVSVGVSARLVVTMADGTDISEKSWEGLRQPDPLPMGQNWIELAPRESRLCHVDWVHSMPNYFHDPRFSGPGIYRLTFHLGASNYPENYAGEVVTNTARLTRAIAGAGEDEALWQRMNTAMSGRWASDSLCNSKPGPAILEDILRAHPNSAYYPYALLLESNVGFPPRRVTKDDISKAVEAASRFPSSPARSQLLFRAAEVAESLAHHALWDHDAKTSAEYLGIAAQYYDTAAKGANVPGVRITAEAGKRRVEAALEHQRQRAAGQEGKVNQ